MPHAPGPVLHGPPAAAGDVYGVPLLHLLPGLRPAAPVPGAGPADGAVLRDLPVRVLLPAADRVPPGAVRVGADLYGSLPHQRGAHGAGRGALLLPGRGAVQEAHPVPGGEAEGGEHAEKRQ